MHNFEAILETTYIFFVIQRILLSRNLKFEIQLCYYKCRLAWPNSLQIWDQVQNTMGPVFLISLKAADGQIAYIQQTEGLL